MDKATLDKIQEQLKEEKKRLEQELAEFSERNIHNENDFNAKFPQYGDKQDENAAEVATYGDYLVLERALEKELRDANEALKNIAQGAYGVCKYCQKPIAEKRLLARPTSSSCVACKKLLTQEA